AAESAFRDRLSPWLCPDPVPERWRRRAQSRQEGSSNTRGQECDETWVGLADATRGAVYGTMYQDSIVVGDFPAFSRSISPAGQRVRGAGSRLKCKNNLKEIGLALPNSPDRGRVFPPGYLGTGATVSMPANDLGPGWGWAAFILPELEQDNVYKQIRFDLDITDPINADIRVTNLAIFQCPSDAITDPFIVDVLNDPTPDY